MATIEATTTHQPSTQARRSPVLVALLALLLGLLAGGVTGWLIRGAGDVTTDVVVAGEGPLADRSADLAEFMDDYEAAWVTGETEAVLAMFAPNGTFTADGTTYRVDDGSFATFLATYSFPGLDVYRPVLVAADAALTFHTIGDGILRAELLRFSTEGDLLLVSHEIVD